MNKLQLYGFNNLTKTLSVSVCRARYAKITRQRYLRDVDERFNARRLSRMLTEIAKIIGARILNIAEQDYQPQGASVTMLVAEGTPMDIPNFTGKPAALFQETMVAHLDKSHITIHTYPENHPSNGIHTFRADIDVSTCGRISPLNTLSYILGRFQPDIAFMDYRIRGFTRDRAGVKLYMDHKIASIQDFLPAGTRESYRIVDVNLHGEKIFHTKMMLKNPGLAGHIFDVDAEGIWGAEVQRIIDRLQKEILEIFNGQNE